ncbi:MAG: SdrD B-like domain-containing protein [Xanthomonadales bacterium]|nr:SdrD B-like domain-containing protein [Xanthomonadales bacterium]
MSRFAKPLVHSAAAVLFALISLPATAQLPPPQEEAYCWAVADGGDSLIFVNKDGDGFNNRGPVGVPNIEAVAFNPGDGRLYTADNDQFGYLDYDDAFDGDTNDSEFVPLGNGVDSVTLPSGATVDINDIDGLQFDLTRIDASTGTFVLWATDREGGADDILFQIDPTTGELDTTPTPGFSNGATGVRMSGVGSLLDIDDIAVDPLTGILYGINNAGGIDDQFGTIDPVTGVFGFISVFRNTASGALVIDMEGFSFSVTGQLYGTTGTGGNATNEDHIWRIDKETGDTTAVLDFPSLSDYESVGCLTDNVISGAVYFDLDADNSFEPADGENGFSNATVRIYIDNNNNNLVDAGDTQLCNNSGDNYNLPCPVTDSNGLYRFPVGQGNFVADVDVATVPSGSTLTHPTNSEEADFGVTDFGQEDPNNNFGFTLPTGSGDLTLTKTSNVPANAVQGQTISYTLTIANPTSELQTGIELTDALPVGVSYVPGSTTATGPAEVFLLDRFDSSAFDGNNGTRNFAGPWVESNEQGGGGGPGAGQIQVTASGMRLDDEPDTAGDPAVERLADLTGFIRAFLAFDFGTTPGVDAADAVRVEVSNGGPFTTLEDITGISGAVAGSRVYDVTSFISATTTVRFTVLDSYHEADEFFTFDNFEIREGANWLDRWDTQAFNNSDGAPDPWATDWLETGEADGAALGDVVQTTDGADSVLRIQGPDNGVEREIDLSAYASARLSLEFRRQGLNSFNDIVSVEVSRNGGGNWTELARLRGAPPSVTDTDYQPLSFDISDFISANTRIRFLSSSNLNVAEQVFIDNVQVDVRSRQTLTKDNVTGGANADLVDGSPPSLIDASDRFVLDNGESVTLTFDVTVDDPLSPAINDLTNSALVSSEQDPLPTTASVTDPVVRGSIGDFVWNDLNGNGLQDGGAEVGIANVTLELDDGSCTLGVDCRTVITDGAGAYLFDNLAPGTYAVNVVDATLPPGSVLSPGLADPVSGLVITAAENILTADFGYVPTGTVSGHLYLDSNNNGTQDAGEPDLANVDVIITDSSGGMQTVTSDANGDWTATVIAGSTTADVDESDPDYPTGATQTEGTDPTVVTAVAGTNVDAGNDGYFLPPTGTVSGHLYLDRNNNGTQDAVEPDLANVDVVVTDSGGGMQTVTSDANGDWTATVIAGSTTADVDETDPDFPTGATQTEGTDPTTVTAVAGTNVDAGNDGYFVPATVTVHLFIDTNGNGTQDAGEPDLAGVDVTITDSGGGMQTVPSDPGGDVSVSVPPGTTTIDVVDGTVPPGLTLTTANDPQTVTAVSGSTVPGTDIGYQPAENPVIGLAKRVLSLTDTGTGSWDVVYRFELENLGDVDLSSVQVTDDLGVTFPSPVTFTVQVAPTTTGTLAANSMFNGGTDQNLLAPASSSLTVGATASITITVRIDPAGLTGPFNNSAVASGTSPTTTVVTDISDDGVDPDTNSNSDPTEPSENDPTPVVIPTGTPAALPVPTLGAWGLLLMSLLLMAAAGRALRGSR